MNNKLSMISLSILTVFGITACSSSGSQQHQSSSSVTSTIYVTSIPNDQSVGPRGGLLSENMPSPSDSYQEVAINALVSSWRIDTKIDKTQLGALKRAQNWYTTRCYQSIEKNYSKFYSLSEYPKIEKNHGYLKVTGQTDAQVVPDQISNNQEYDAVDLYMEWVDSSGTSHKLPDKRYLLSLTKTITGSTWLVDSITEG